MSRSETTIDIELLKRLEPLKELANDRLQELATKAKLIDLVEDRELFKEGERDNRTLYLLSGELKLSNRTGASMVLKSSNRASRQPIDNQNPHIISAWTRSSSKILSIDSDLLDMLLNWGDEDSGGYEVEEVDFSDDADWISNLLYTQGLLNLPPQSIQALVTRLREVSLSAGEVVLNEGEEDDDYYIIKQGRCLVSRVMPGDSEPTVLCELKAGEGFGEEALITQGRRNATVTMAEDGVLLKLDKSDFNSLIASFLVSQVDGREAQELVATGTMVIDVRTPEEYHQNGVGRSMPLALLRREMSHFDPDRKYIVCCDDGRRSAAAAFLMRRMGLNVHALQGGLEMHRGEIEQALEQLGEVKHVGEAPVARNVATPTPLINGESGKDQVTALQQQNMRLQSEVKKSAEQTALIKSQLEKALTAQLHQTDEAKSAYRQVATEMATLRQEMESLQSGASRDGKALNGQLGSVKGELEAALKRAAGAEAGQGSLEQEISRLHDEHATQRRESEARLQEQTKQLERANELMASVKAEHSEALQKLQGEIEQARQQAIAAESERDERAAAIDTLSKSQAESEAELQRALEQAQQQLESSAQLLAEREAELDSVRGSQSESLSQFEDGVEEARKRALEAEQMVAQERRAADVIKREHAEALAALQRELEQSRQRVETSESELTGQLQALESLKWEQQSVIESLEGELAQMRERAEQAEAAIAAVEQERTTLEETIARQQQEVDEGRKQYEAELEAARNEIVELKGRIAELGNEKVRIRVELEAEIGQLNATLDQSRREIEKREATLTEAERREAELRSEFEAQQRALDEIREQHKHEIEQALLKIQQLHAEKGQLSEALTTAQSETAAIQNQIAEESQVSSTQIGELRVLFEQYKRENAKLKAEIVAKSLATEAAAAAVPEESRIDRSKRRRYATQAASSAWMMLSSEHKEGGEKQEVDWSELPTFEMGAEYGDEDNSTPVDTGWTQIKTKW